MLGIPEASALSQKGLKMKVSEISDRRTFTKTAIAGLTAVVLGSRAESTLAMRPGPSSATNIKPTMDWFLRDLFTEVSNGDFSKVTPNAQVALPEEPIKANFLGILSTNVDLNGEINVGVVYSGLRRDGGLYYDFLHLRVEDGDYIVTNWENRLPTAD
jgi:hypothetical protein